MNQDIRFCTAPDGVKLAYALSGDGPLLVMASTWLTHLEHQWRSLAWRPWLDAFATFRVLRHDSRGCGLSDRDTDDLSFDNWINDLATVLDAAGLRRFPMIATCWGGPVAIEYAARHPERVSHLVLYGTYARGRLRADDPEVRRKARLMLELTRHGWSKDHAFMQVWSSTFQPGGTLDYLRSWVQSFVADDKIYCVYVAPDEGMVRAHAQKGGLPANSVARVRAVIDQTTAEAAAA